MKFREWSNLNQKRADDIQEVIQNMSMDWIRDDLRCYKISIDSTAFTFYPNF